MEITANEKRTKDSDSRRAAQAAPLLQGKEGIGPDGFHGNAQGMGYGLAGLKAAPGSADGRRDGLPGQLIRLGYFIRGDALEDQLSPDFPGRPAIVRGRILFHLITQKGASMRLNEDRTVAELEIKGAMTVPEIETLIARLAVLRANMLPPVADAPPSPQDPDLDSREISVQANPSVELRVLTEDRIRLWIRNLGTGWMAFDLAPDTAETLARFILTNLGDKSYATGFFSEQIGGSGRAH